MTLRELLIGKSVGRSLVRGLLIGVVLLLGSRFLLTPVRAHGISMVPTYAEGQLLWVNRLAYRFGTPVRRGDVVAITLRSGEAVLVKRIVGLPGERIRIVEGQVLINGQPLDEPYCVYRLPWNILEAQLGPDEIFVVGDNRSMKERFHDFGRASTSRILGTDDQLMRPRWLLAAAVLVGASAAAWALWPDEARRVRAQVEAAAEALSVPAGEPEMQRMCGSPGSPNASRRTSRSKPSLAGRGCAGARRSPAWRRSSRGLPGCRRWR